MRRKVKAVYFSDLPEDVEMLAWVERKGNFSRYVRGLIAADMRGEVDPRVLAAVERLVEAKMKEVRPAASKVGEIPVPDDCLKGMF